MISSAIHRKHATDLREVVSLFSGRSALERGVNDGEGLGVFSLVPKAGDRTESFLNRPFLLQTSREAGRPSHFRAAVRMRCARAYSRLSRAVR